MFGLEDFKLVDVLRDRLCGLVVSSWLRSQRSGFDSRCYQIFWEVVDLERGPLSLVSTIEALLGRKSSGSGLNREYGRRDPSRKTFTLTFGLSVGIVRSRTKATEFIVMTLRQNWSSPSHGMWISAFRTLLLRCVMWIFGRVVGVQVLDSVIQYVFIIVSRCGRHTFL
jgi:hypothetical protein